MIEVMKTFKNVILTTQMSEETKENQKLQRPAPRLNERILSSLSRRSVAAHPWHDLEIGKRNMRFNL